MNLWIVFVYIFIIIPTILLTFRNGRVVYEEEKKVGFVTRKMNYLSEILVNRETANERALVGFAPSLNKRFMKTRE
ncbi:hypothetical protein [Clostridium ihumii]|uniref:hypothetical protein n=1 Tax=Clostridium ihumii TaxID=1470356 RepID=UPI0011DD50E2|nr:hypothetical protein [Clostridium ihumii]